MAAILADPVLGSNSNHLVGRIGERMKFLATVCAIAVLLTSAEMAFADRWDGGYDSLERQHGNWSRYSDEDVLLEFVIFRHGKKNGTSILYHASGNEYVNATYQDDVLHGHFAEHYDDADETLKETGQFKNNLKTGDWKAYHINGQLHYTTSFFNGREDGLRTTHFASGPELSGPVATEANYKRGVLDGEYFSFFDNDGHDMQFSGTHTNNLRSGLWMEWFSTGELKSMIEYVAGVMHGPASTGYNSGQLAVETSYSAGKLHGEYTGYFDNRAHSKQYQGSHKNGVRDGNWTEWYENGNLASETRYVLGQLNGPASYYQQYDGSLDYFTEYQDNQHHGAYIKYFFPKPLQTATGDDTTADTDDVSYRQEWGRHEQGQRVNGWIWLHGNGETQKTGGYLDGLPVGVWHEYNENGDLTTISNYDAGQLSSQQTDCHLATVRCDTD